MADLAGSSFANLPPDRHVLAAQMERSTEAISDSDGKRGDRLYVLVMEDVETGCIAGTAQVWSQVGVTQPFYSYRLGATTRHSAELGRTFRNEVLTLVTDLEGASKVGGLFLHPHLRGRAWGMLLARSRYLFIRRHRACFADRLLAELRGVIDERGGAPFWDGLAGRIFGLSFRDADAFNAVDGNQFIANLMPKHPIHRAMLTDAARAAICTPHPTQRTEMRMLQAEGFNCNGYMNIFDGGPTMTVATDNVRTIRETEEVVIQDVGVEDGHRALLASGGLAGFRVTLGEVSLRPGLAIDRHAADALGVDVGDTILFGGYARGAVTYPAGTKLAQQ